MTVFIEYLCTSVFVLIPLFFFIRSYLTKRFKNYSLPPNSMYYFLFLAFMLLSTLWSKNPSESFRYFYLFLSGYWFWAVFHNEQKTLKKVFPFLLSVIAIMYGLSAVANISFGDTNPLSLIVFATPPKHHHHIGDLWVPVLLILGHKFSTLDLKHPLLKPNPILVGYFLLIFFGVILLFISLSRSSYVALIAGSMVFIYNRKLYHSKNFKLPFSKKHIFWLYILISVVLFLYAGTRKSTLVAHGGYVVQGVSGFWNNPLGVGFGNFKDYAQRFELFNLEFEGGSSSAHNIILEIFAGMGLMGITFPVFLYKILKSFFMKKHNAENVLYKALFITIFVNFLFDYTYLIPLIFWSWFAVLGLSLEKSDAKDVSKLPIDKLSAPK